MCRIGATGESPLYGGFGELGAELTRPLRPLCSIVSFRTITIHFSLERLVTIISWKRYLLYPNAI